MLNQSEGFISSQVQTHINEFVNEFPLHQWYRTFYRFFANHEYYSGAIAGDNIEPGFLRGCYIAFVEELAHINEELTIDVIERIHNNVINGVLNLNYTPKELREGKITFRKQNEFVGFGLIPGSNMSENGIKEIEDQQNDNPLEYELKIAENSAKGRYYKLACLSSESKKMAEKVILEYNKKVEELDKAKLDLLNRKKAFLSLLCDMVSRLERLHPYKDGNCRTLCLVMLNRELIKNGYSPTIMDNPNQFDAFSQKELILKIKEGQVRYQELLKTGVLETPFRFGKVYVKNSQERILPKNYNQQNLTDFASMSIEDEFEQKDGVPYVGEENSNIEILISRLTVESALNHLLNRLYSDHARLMLDRMNLPMGLKDFSESQKLQYQRFFYSSDLNQVFYCLTKRIIRKSFSGPF